MAGFRDRTGSRLDMWVLPQPVVIVVIGLGAGPITVESASGHQPLRGLVASLSPRLASPRPARIRGEGVECVEVALSPGPPTPCWACPHSNWTAPSPDSRTAGGGTLGCRASSWPTPHPGRNASNSRAASSDGRPGGHDPAPLPPAAATWRRSPDRGARASRGRQRGGRGYLPERPQHDGERGGRERTRADFEEVCRRAALRVRSITPLADAALYSLIEAVAD